MENKRRFLIIATGVLVLAALLSVGFNSPKTEPEAQVVANTAAEPAKAELTITGAQKILSEETLMSILWMQRASEYRALCYQAYNIALERVKWAVVNDKAQGGQSLPLAIVLDLDETVLDNTSAEAIYVAHDRPYREDDLSNWAVADKVEAMPGAAKFLQAIDRLGVQIFYVTNRRQDVKEPIANSLKRLEFPQVEDSHMLMKTESSDKTSRFEQIQTQHNVILYLGDNLGDMPVNAYSADSAGRSAIADQNEDKFGVSYIVLPNPIYGNWESSLAEGYYNLSPEKRYKVRHESLKVWDEKPAESVTAN